MAPLRTITRWFTALPFGLRLFGALAIAMATVGIVLYATLSDRMKETTVGGYLSALQADAANFEVLGEQTSRNFTYQEIGDFLAGTARRPGTTQALLIGPGGRTVAAGDRADLGDQPADEHIEGVLEGGAAVGVEDGSGDDERIELVVPLELPNGTHALVIRYDADAFEAPVAEMRDVLIVVGSLGLVAIAVLFYVFGGRALLRSHDAALHRATRDGLTDLPNHRAFQEDLDRTGSLAERHGEALSLALVDLDQFKLVNDRYGHPEGDALLVRVAEILRRGRGSDRAFRIGGDEFALILPRTGEAGARAVVGRLMRSLRGAGVEASVGVASSRGGDSCEELRPEADAALYEAKRRGRRQAVHFHEIRGQVAITTVAKREAVGRMIDEGRVGTVFQPIWDFASQQLVGMEALARPEADVLSGPSEAFDIAEQIGRAHELDELCVRTALASAPEVPGAGLLFLNLDPKTLSWTPSARTGCARRSARPATSRARWPSR